MDAFLPAAPILEMHPRGDRWRLVGEFRHRTRISPAAYGYSCLLPWVHDSDGAAVTEITIPAGFVTDFASVPSLLWSVIGPQGDHARSALVHDYLYTAHPAGRPWADAVFCSAMVASGVPAWRRWVEWLAVRIGGRKYWDGPPLDWPEP